MNQEFEIRDIPLSSPYFKKKAESFLAARSLKMADLDYLAGIYDSDDTLCGCGGTDKQTIK